MDEEGDQDGWDRGHGIDEVWRSSDSVNVNEVDKRRDSRGELKTYANTACIETVCLIDDLGGILVRAGENGYKIGLKMYLKSQPLCLQLPDL